LERTIYASGRHHARRKRILAAGFGVVLATAAFELRGAENSWVGPAQGAWSTPANWSTGNVPQSGDNVRIDGGSNQNTAVRLTADAAINDLSIHTGDRLTVGTTSLSELILTGSALFNAGTLELGAGGSQRAHLVVNGPSLTFSGGGTMSLESSLVVGPGRVTNLDNIIHMRRSVIGGFAPGWINRGLIYSSEPSTSSAIFSNTNVPFQNRGTLRATNQSFLTLDGDLGRMFDNAGGRMDAVTAGAISLEDAHVIGGTLGPGDLYIQGYATGTLENLSTSGVWSVGGTMGLKETIVNSGIAFVQGRVYCNGSVTLAGAGTWHLSAGGRFGGSGTLVNVGNHLRGAGNIGSNTIAIENREAGVIRALNGTLTIDPKPGSTFVNAGTLRADGGAVLALSGNGGGEFTNVGMVEVIAGATVGLVEGGQLTNLTGDTFTAGRWLVYSGATLDFGPGAAITNNAAHVRLEGPNSRFDAMDSMRANTGRFELDKHRDFASPAALTNSGELFLGSGSDLRTGDSFAQTSDGQLKVHIGGLSPDDYGQVHAGGAALLDGALVVTSSVTIPNHYAFTLLTSPTVTGTFEALDLPSLPIGRYWSIDYRSDAVVLRVVPDPSGLSAAALLLLTTLRRQRPRAAGSATNAAPAARSPVRSRMGV
jgi:hypothetical protein